MRLRLFVLSVASFVIAQSRAQSDSTRSTSTSSAPRATVRPGAKGLLPDPTLLDGSTQPPEKHPDYGMLGDFEIPGDENSKSGKVAGQQNPNQQPGGGGGPQQQNQSQGGGQQGGLPQGAAGAAGGPQSQTASQGAPQGGGQQGGAQQGGQQAGQNSQGTSGGAQGGDPTGKADGVQVAGLEGEGVPGQSGGAGAGGDNVPKPQQVAIGDPTMQIKSAAAAPGVVGQVAAGSTQNMESKIGKGSGGGGSAPTSGRGGSGVEKGRAMPAGL